MRCFVFLILAMLVAMPALAHSEKDPRNRASFQVQATREVANDWVVARLSVVSEGKDAAAVADEVNRRMKAALDAARAAKAVDVRSGAYVTQPVYDDGRVVRWRASQELRLEAEDVERLSKLIGALQGQSVLLSGIEFSVRRETREQLTKELTEEALAAFRERADVISKSMGAKGWSLIQLSVGDSGGARPMVRMHHEARLSSMAEAAPPAFEAGTSEIQIRVDGSVELD